MRPDRPRAIAGIVVGCLLALLAADQAGGETPADGPAASRRWTTAREAFDGPTLDEAWFAKRRTVVYLVPNGQMGLFRRAAGAIMRDRWTSGDWSLKHVFVSAADGKVKFVAGQRVGLRDTALEITRAAGQPEEFVETTESFVREHVYFVHDPDGTAWQELAGPSSDKAQPAVALLDYGGSVVKIISLDLASASTSAAKLDNADAGARLAEEVRNLLPVRPELGG